MFLEEILTILPNFLLAKYLPNSIVHISDPYKPTETSFSNSLNEKFSYPAEFYLDDAYYYSINSFC